MKLKNFKVLTLIIFFLFFIFLSLILFKNNILFYFNKSRLNIFYEGLTNQNDSSIIINKNDAFCKTELNLGGSNLEKSCKKLTQNNCNSLSCCIWTNENKCTSGNENGPIFNTETNGKTKNLKYYYFQNKCFGENCP